MARSPVAIYSGLIALASFLLIGCSSRPHFEETARPSANTAAPPKQGRYELFIPNSQRGHDKPIPLLVLIHGCRQSAKAMEAGTQMNALAEANGFAVLYPDQLKGRHPFNCWQWFLRENQMPNSGELGEIRAMIKEAQAKTAIDPTKVFVAGLSSGSGTAAALLACYPEVFAGGALHSGPAYGYVDDESSAIELIKNGPPAHAPATRACDPSQFKGRLLVIQGTADKVVNPSNATRLFEDFKPKDSMAKATRSRISKTTLGGGIGAYPPVAICRSSQGHQQSCKLTLNGLAHAWSGGAPDKPFMDPQGLSANDLIVRFVMNGENL